MEKKSPPKDDYDPFLALKYIAYIRSRGIGHISDFDFTSMVDFAKWQVCKVRNVLFNDPVWDSYTQEEVIIEYLTIKFDDSEELADDFVKIITGGDVEEVSDWFDEQVEKHKNTQNPPPQEFEDSFE